MRINEMKEVLDNVLGALRDFDASIDDIEEKYNDIEEALDNLYDKFSVAEITLADIDNDEILNVAFKDLITVRSDWNDALDGISKVIDAVEEDEKDKEEESDLLSSLTGIYDCLEVDDFDDVRCYVKQAIDELEELALEE